MMGNFIFAKNLWTMIAILILPQAWGKSAEQMPIVADFLRFIANHNISESENNNLDQNKIVSHTRESGHGKFLHTISHSGQENTKNWTNVIRDLFLKWGYKLNQIPKPFGYLDISKHHRIYDYDESLLKILEKIHGLPKNLEKTVQAIAHNHRKHNTAAEKEEIQKFCHKKILNRILPKLDILIDLLHKADVTNVKEENKQVQEAKHTHFQSEQKSVPIKTEKNDLVHKEFENLEEKIENTQIKTEQVLRKLSTGLNKIPELVTLIKNKSEPIQTEITRENVLAHREFLNLEAKIEKTQIKMENSFRKLNNGLNKILDLATSIKNNSEQKSSQSEQKTEPIKTDTQEILSAHQEFLTLAAKIGQSQIKMEHVLEKMNNVLKKIPELVALIKNKNKMKKTSIQEPEEPEEQLKLTHKRTSTQTTVDLSTSAPVEEIQEEPETSENELELDEYTEESSDINPSEQENDETEAETFTGENESGEDEADELEDKTDVDKTAEAIKTITSVLHGSDKLSDYNQLVAKPEENDEVLSKLREQDHNSE